uniref:Gamma-butyrobetaine hydroxylase-like N-terminal domain-containing protein n=1 Tax=uncultured marine group II/III euryarchaeote KM3_109_G01 TaxID=1457850 RepID=A0A075GCG7_9EURY|nr:hypothetical protein [uncultured marine group II/III euryarchaeote KM3_109_G01]
MATKEHQLTRLERLDNRMQLTWADGVEQAVLYSEVRYWCPCASCSISRNEPDQAAELRDVVESLPAEKPTVTPVGGYAVQFEWVRGCSAGIHRFERLRRLGDGEDPDSGKPYVHGAW